jgi:hypothetical protein
MELLHEHGMFLDSRAVEHLDLHTSCVDEIVILDGGQARGALGLSVVC